MKFILLAIITCVLFSCSETYKQSKVLLKAEDENITYIIVERQVQLGIETSLIVVDHGVEKVSIDLDDDAPMIFPRIAIWENWVFAANDNSIWGGYNLSNGIHYGENQWNKLPHLELPESARVLVEKRVNGRQLCIPANYPNIRKERTNSPPPNDNKALEIEGK
jgi:hypothetical protein